MTFWEQFVKPLRDNAAAIQKFAYHGNYEVPITYEVLMAQATATEQVLKRWYERGTPHERARIGLPE